ncbi:E3 SUMO-protein ligase KIAA1586-like [Acipenser ruthenus]|uniref:E3 SUMO-protein ligase KIAA1586-like n=1 Tax=Acipenser ruthenus TaxID=7906 RepID=UPI00274291FB|nr:E3 SUMO-protein ligase KIAA1586-like [Acipenser ruthenus]XP_058846359.1 E3 SUMO-protein ligase KIAA1586-like [Acipenser ruthenus]XP_058852862.1 E3 SUMO-protein ligase KIAA1586-like [Acipenser ruthenus]XP_058853743.1 E3 SUMO-protein ligase KIAA1586-like [Acipenser ruthenus]XP_058853744.1 E3 SUMO-protein ligase KIAA1586-like [Acipenser ruthenus]XP_058860469.1 E3 SUMO-protein ligase KIAA1586-like [Acipenser ruthenus]XP_058864167.1 E3 SUMO-protein ligase KIAA1586-like [Acipenser ruthenus]XP_0
MSGLGGSKRTRQETLIQYFGNSSKKQKIVCCTAEAEPTVEPEPTAVEEKSAEKQPWPNIWSSEVWEEKKQLYTFLDCADGNLGCRVCRRVSALSVLKSQGVSLSSEWKNYSVGYNGKTREQQLRSLRKKIAEHKKSSAHNKATALLQQNTEDIIGKCVDSAKRRDHETTCKIFSTAYYLAKQNRPYSDHQALLELQEINGVNVGTGLHSRYSATQIINHVSDEMVKKACERIIHIDGKIAVLIDESTALNGSPALIVHLKCETDKTRDPHFMFLELVELFDQSAESIVLALTKCLQKHGFDHAYLQKNLVAFASDGASVMLGKKSGVAKRISDMYPNIVVWHCLNHRLELAVADSVSETTGMNHFHSFMDKLYSVYSRSALNQQELRNCAKELDAVLRKIGRVLDVRWVSSSFRTVSAVWESFEVLSTHFKAAVSSKRTSAERATYSGLLKRLCSPEFLIDLGVMYDALYELSLLSEILQKRTTTLVYADKMARRTVRIFESMNENVGTKTLEAQIAAMEGTFKSTVLTSNPKHVKINHKQFLTKLANHMKERLFTTTASNEKASSEVNCQKYESLLSELLVLDPHHWPAELPQGYGENEVERLCRRFQLNERIIKNAFRDFKENNGRIPDDLAPLINCTRVIPCSTAECERGFSQMNLIITDQRSKILIKHASALMFIKLHGPPLRQWNPSPYVTTWLRHNHRSADDSRTRVAAPISSDSPDALWQFL